MGDIRRPVVLSRRQRGHCQQGQENIGQGRRHHCNGKDREGAFEREFGLARGMRDRLKSHKSPRRQGEDQKASAEGAVIGGKGRRKDLSAAGMVHGCCEAEHHTAKEHNGHEDLCHLRRPPVQAQQSGDKQTRRRQENLAKVDVEARDGVVKAELKHIAQHSPCDQRQGGGIGPDDGNIGQNEEPCAEEAVVIPKTLFGVGIGAAAVGIAIHQEVIIRCQDQHHQAAAADADGCADRAGNRQEGRAGHDESAQGG